MSCKYVTPEPLLNVTQLHTEHALVQLRRRAETVLSYILTLAIDEKKPHMA